MKKILALLTLVMIIQSAEAQDSWTIKLNNKLLLTASKMDTVANTKKIKQLEWRKSGYLEITYKESTRPTWIHSFYFTDKKEEKSLTKDSTTYCKIPVATLRKIFAGKKEIEVYMIISPPNPMMAAPTRRLLLCTLLLP